MSTLRRSAKVLVVDDDGRVLLFSGIDRTKPDVPPWWFPVGGALEPGETHDAAAVREVQGETGLRIAGAGHAVLTRRFEWDFEGELYDQEEVYFLARVHSFEPVATGWTETEAATIRGHRWWSIDELRQTEDVVYPEGLADVLDRLLDSQGAPHRGRPDTSGAVIGERRPGDVRCAVLSAPSRSRGGIRCCPIGARTSVSADGTGGPAP